MLFRSRRYKSPLASVFLAEVIDSGVERDKLDTRRKPHVEIRRFWPSGASDDTGHDQGEWIEGPSGHVP